MSKKVETCEARLEQQGRLLTAKSEVLRAAELRMEEGWALAKKLNAQLNAQPVRVKASVSKKDDEVVIRRLREMLSKTDGEIMTAKRDLKEMEANTASRERTFSIRIYQLEEQLSHERQQTKTDSSKKVRSLTAELQERTDQLAAVKHRLAAAETRMKQSRQQDDTKYIAQHQDPIAQNQELAAQYQELLAQHEATIAQNQELQAQSQELAAQYQELAAQHQELVAQKEGLDMNYEVLHQMYLECEGPSAAMQQERDSAMEQVFLLRLELSSSQAVAEEMTKEAQESVARAQQTEEVLRQSMRDLKDACDSTLKQERADSEGTREQVETLEGKIVLLKSKLRMATKDIQRADGRAVAAEKAKAALEKLLASKQVDRVQETPKARPGELKSITTVLQQSQVKISEQQTEIDHLRNQLSQVSQGLLGPSDQVLHEKARELRELLDKEKRQRNEDQIRWDKKTRELEEETRKLRISNSNNDAALVHRGRRKATPF
ncbi:uncharacterized protein BO80DRAFT_457924 [Aspergillus ibericus CBS 121593]|uniref:Uncharacterized protein n=1 Tax=Aspergillus ibericus CBS 121593 TaxID=1448316 RepID=A0A395GQA0_9EURO|nr:hypothetical protein BO80DRAFT_457924 [Aspergillus ibericus CBS 121593]RAK97665.1 hypothetical protein BO80DRAFT_457924 [Aspergillus ibericus CBS 121593]